MIKEFISSKIDDFFGSLDTTVHAYMFGDAFIRWERNIRDFSDEIFRKWVVSRSAKAVNHLLDDGLATCDEQKIVKRLEQELNSYFDSALGSFFRSLLVPIKSAFVGAFLWIVVTLALFVYCSNYVWRFAVICLLVAGICFSAAIILHLVDRNTLSRKSKHFLVQFFVEAENRWMKLQQQYIQEEGVQS